MSQNSDWQNNNPGSRDQGRRAVEPEILEPEETGNANQYDRKYYSKTGVWTYVPADSGGCLAASITFALFLVCLGQFGLLAAIGFFFFHSIGSIIGSVHTARSLIAGIPVNPWTWRTGNWIISLLITIMLAS